MAAFYNMRALAGATGEALHSGVAMTRIIRPLTPAEMTALEAYISRVDLQRAILHLDHVPWYLPRRFSGIARGRHVYFRPGVYREGTVEGLALLGHELIHVSQYRNGMTALSYLYSVIAGYRNSRYERVAYAVQARILGDLRRAA
jgi:hypothetical protein